MKRIFFLLPFVGLLFSANLIAQRVCGSMEVLHRQLDADPNMSFVRQEIERQTSEYLANPGAHDRVVVTIPVVVHVVWKTTAQNVSDAQIQSQIDVLNADYRALNADIGSVPPAFQGLVADIEVNFCMAQQTPSGAATNGIERRSTTLTSWSTNDAVKYYAQGGLDVWDRTRYLNLWVCNLSGGVLGYAQFPGGPAATDGVVITYSGFGTIGSAVAPFNKGRTATHEVGHWLNLYHIWGDDGSGCSGSDLVTDTPNQADENYGCPAFPAVSCSNGPNGDMFMNYMDYTDDACMFMFSNGQKTRMQAVLGAGGSRASLASSPGCTPGGGGGSCGTPSGLAASSIAQTSASLGWAAVSGATAYTLQWKTTAGSTWTTVNNGTSTTYSLTGLTANTSYDYRVLATCGSTAGSYSASTSFTTLASGGGGCADQFESNNTLATAYASTPVGTAFTAQIATSSDKDYYKFSNTSTQRNIKVDLTTLPADYDLRLYKVSSQVGISQLAGTASEQIIYNTSSANNVTNYTAYVYGYSGAFSSTACYTLKISLSSSSWRTDGTTNGAVTQLEIPAVFENEGFTLAPNPAEDVAVLTVPMVKESPVTVALLDATGRSVFSQTSVMDASNNSVKLELGKVAAGLYFVQVRGGDAVKTLKLVVTK